MTLHRFEVQPSQRERMGVFCWAYDEEFFPDPILGMAFALTQPFEALPDPRETPGWNLDESVGYRCWFTDKGYKRFRKALRKIKVYAEAHDTQFHHMETSFESVSSDDIVYQDPLQVWIRCSAFQPKIKEEVL